MWLKYDDKPIDLSSFKYVEQEGRLSEYTKPRGCWITDDTEQCWREWCLSENYGADGLTHKHEVVLDESRILILRSAWEMDAFTGQYAVDRYWGGPDERKYCDKCIDWREVAKAHTGIIITPYQWSRRLEPYSWYYGWDCASGCIWEPSAIREIKLIEIDHEVAKAREAA